MFECFCVSFNLMSYLVALPTWQPSQYYPCFILFSCHQPLNLGLQISHTCKVDAVFNKARRWQLTSHTPYSADLIEQCYKHLFRAALNPTHCLHSLLPPKKNIYDRNLRKKGHGCELPFAKTKLYKDSFLIRCIYKYV